MTISGESNSSGDRRHNADPFSAGGEPRSDASPSSAAGFNPFFIVGCQRSGTTALAVMFDRHSALAVPSETQFFCTFVRLDSRKRLPMTHEQLLSRACDDFFIHQTGLRYEEMIEIFRRYEPTYPNLFRAILESFAAKQGKRRTAEKSCDHIHHVPELLRLFPGARVICIIRDGRDVVQSMIAAWGTKLLGSLCRLWIMKARVAARLQRKLPRDRFTMVKYGDLILRPDEEMKRLCEFIGEEFEPSQLDKKSESASVPVAELDWKAKAKDRPDASRVGAWRRNGDPERIAQLNFYMGPMLRKWGFTDTEVVGVSWTKRLRWWLQYIPCWRGVFPVAVRVNRVFRGLRNLVTGQSAQSAEV